jgi:hypothetical protein
MTVRPSSAATHVDLPLYTLCIVYRNFTCFNLYFSTINALYLIKHYSKYDPNNRTTSIFPTTTMQSQRSLPGFAATSLNYNYISTCVRVLMWIITYINTACLWYSNVNSFALQKSHVYAQTNHHTTTLDSSPKQASMLLSSPFRLHHRQGTKLNDEFMICDDDIPWPAKRIHRWRNIRDPDVESRY